MSGCIPITVTPGITSQSVQIQVNPSFAITPIHSASPAITPAPPSAQQVDVTSGQFTITSTVDAPTATLVGGIAVQTPINLEIGSAVSTELPELLNSHIVKFTNFVITNAESYNTGDCIVMVPGSNAYNSDITKADTSILTRGAYNNIWMFLNYSGNDLILLQKGYFDFSNDSTNFGNWMPGRTLYLNAEGILDLLPSATSLHWVKSMGYCIPNTENKKRIWFEPDTTYLKRS